ncbi:DNA mismatch repair protein Msh3p [Monosporozyma servazzii]
MAKQLQISRFFKSAKKEIATSSFASSLDGKPSDGATPETSICLSDDEDFELLENAPQKVQLLDSSQVVSETREPSGDAKGEADNDLKVEPDNNTNGEADTEPVKTSTITRKRKVIEMADANDLAGIQPIKRSKSKAITSGLSKLTPLDEQVRQLKLDNMDKILVIRVGYKYKCFAQDAIIVADILQIKLVEGKLSFDDSNPQDKMHKQYAYCSFPDVRLDVHLERLIHHNLKVGVVEQAETSAIKKQSNNKNNVFERKVSTVFSKATYGVNIPKSTKFKDTNLLGDTKSIWVLRLTPNSDRNKMTYTLLSVNLNSGEIIFDEFTDMMMSTDELLTRTKYLEPIEVLIINQQNEEYMLILNKFLKDNECQRQDLTEISDIEDLCIAEIDKIDSMPKNFDSLIKQMYSYLQQYNTENVLTIASNYKPFISKMYMLLDGNAIDALDIFSNNGKNGSLLWVLDHTRTPFGYRTLREWIKRPLLNRQDIENRLDAIECASDSIGDLFFESLNQMLKSMPDLLHILNRITYGRSSRKEVYYFLKQISSLSKHFKLHSKYIHECIQLPQGKIQKKSKLLYDLFNDINEYFQLSKPDVLFSMINVSAVLDKDTEKQIIGFFNLNNYDRSKNLIRIQRDIDGIKEDLNNELQNIKRILKRPHLTFRNEVEYLVEVRNTQLKGIPADWVKVNCTKMVSRFLTPECGALVDKLQYHKELLMNEAESEYQHFLSLIKTEYVPLKKVIQSLSEYDCILSLAATSCNTDYVRPTFDETKGQFIDIENGRNAVIESLDINYVPNDAKMNHQTGRINIITGPNMGGKSSYIRQVALLIIMAQIGSFVPADSMSSSLFDNILTRIGAYDDLIGGQSTFKVEMSEILHIIKNATPRSLLLLDEVGRGTGTIDGKAISYSILKYFIELEASPLILFTTHFTMLGEQIESEIKGVLQNHYMDYLELQNEGEDWQSVIFLYKLKPGSSKDSFGLNVAKLASVDKDIINLAHKISSKIKEEEEFFNNSTPLQIRSILTESETSPQTKLKRLIELASTLM